MPSVIPKRAEKYDTALVLADILDPFSAILPSWLPTKICSKSFGEAIVVASAKFVHVTVGIVLMAPFANEYGKGHRRIMQRSFNPSCFSTRLTSVM